MNNAKWIERKKIKEKFHLIEYEKKNSLTSTLRQDRLEYFTLNNYKTILK